LKVTAFTTNLGMTEKKLRPITVTFFVTLIRSG
jgi:hypothetical protein